MNFIFFSTGIEIFEVDSDGRHVEYDEVYNHLSDDYRNPVLLPVDLGSCKDPYAYK